MDLSELIKCYNMEHKSLFTAFALLITDCDCIATEPLFSAFRSDVNSMAKNATTADAF